MKQMRGKVVPGKDLLELKAFAALKSSGCEVLAIIAKQIEI